MCKPSDVGIVSKVTMSSMKGGEGYSHSAGPASTSSSVEHKPFIRSGGGGGGHQTGQTRPHCMCAMVPDAMPLQPLP